jgi:hypothetical protein
MVGSLIVHRPIDLSVVGYSQHLDMRVIDTPRHLHIYLHPRPYLMSTPCAGIGIRYK